MSDARGLRCGASAKNAWKSVFATICRSSPAWSYPVSQRMTSSTSALVRPLRSAFCTYNGYTLAKEVAKMRWPGIADPPSEPMSSSAIVGWVEPEAIPITSYWVIHDGYRCAQPILRAVLLSACPPHKPDRLLQCRASRRPRLRYEIHVASVPTRCHTPFLRRSLDRHPLPQRGPQWMPNSTVADRPWESSRYRGISSEIHASSPGYHR